MRIKIVAPQYSSGCNRIFYIYNYNNLVTETSHTHDSREHSGDICGSHQSSGNWPHLRRIDIQELDEEYQSYLLYVKEKMRTDIPQLSVVTNSGVSVEDSLLLSKEAKFVARFLHNFIERDVIMRICQHQDLNGEKGWDEIMMCNPNLEEDSNGNVRFKRQIWVHGIPNFNWREKLSPDAQKLYQLVETGLYKEEEIKIKGREQEVNVETAIEELKSFDGLYWKGPFNRIGIEIRILEEDTDLFHRPCN